MAATYSRCRTWWCILRILFVLFATVAQCRKFVEDIEIGDLQNLNNTSPAVKVGTPPPSPFASSPEEENYQNAIDKGCSHLNMMRTGSASPTIFFDRDSLFDNGWVDQPDQNELGDAPPSAGGTPGVELELDVAEVYRQLQISDTTDDNLMFRWTQRRQGGPGSTQAAYGQAGTSDYFPRNTPYGMTGAYYENQLNPVGGILLSMFNFGPEYMLHAKGTSGPPPPMKRLSDVLWFQWVDACRVFGVHVNNIRYFYQQQVSDELTEAIMDVVIEMPDQEVRAWPGVDYYMDDPGVNGDIGKALLGSPNGHAVAFFLAQHAALIGRRLTVDKVRWWGDLDKDYDQHMLFYILEVPEADDALTPTPS
ncbi:hypothetical protein LTR54_012022 [Friedmanniomyces endolithicus]|nr:hypothetical protein LTR54_012022 [Friedmanniomyces endolithicus]